MTSTKPVLRPWISPKNPKKSLLMSKKDKLFLKGSPPHSIAIESDSPFGYLNLWGQALFRKCPFTWQCIPRCLTLSPKGDSFFKGTMLDCEFAKANELKQQEAKIARAANKSIENLDIVPF
tara:strand:- start:134 stop:496 length:363 start_codon:yes stop_codon:yes gene_type:complete